MPSGPAPQRAVGRHSRPASPLRHAISQYLNLSCASQLAVSCSSSASAMGRPAPPLPTKPPLHTPPTPTPPPTQPLHQPPYPRRLRPQLRHRSPNQTTSTHYTASAQIPELTHLFWTHPRYLLSKSSIPQPTAKVSLQRNHRHTYLPHHHHHYYQPPTHPQPTSQITSPTSHPLRAHLPNQIQCTKIHT